MVYNFASRSSQSSVIALQIQNLNWLKTDVLKRGLAVVGSQVPIFVGINFFRIYLYSTKFAEARSKKLFVRNSQVITCLWGGKHFYETMLSYLSIFESFFLHLSRYLCLAIFGAFIARKDKISRNFDGASQPKLHKLITVVLIIIGRY